ncbi:MAG: RecX family transcriptional regulator [Gemmatimonadaceae bacterium]|nr:RecX family transcriptional regulator [Gemmatimonadaceae bacterium]NUQ94626.1 RecX family transcriptional regulator [Gemmatimonadaceae bacterium]NUS97223.1 RecX family transcriptional regulator [Gemmatimonadaceae bacterium]
MASPRAPGRFTVMVDGKSGPTLGLEAIERLHLVVGGSTLGREQDVADEAEALRVYDRAATMLAARGRAARDLEKMLVRKGEQPELARKAVERLTAQGFLDDAVYARSFVRSKSSGAGLARRRLEQELGRKGVDRAVVAEAIDEVFEEEERDEAASAEALARKRSRTLRDADPRATRRRLYAYLARRGYSVDVINEALDRVGASDGESFDEE